MIGESAAFVPVDARRRSLRIVSPFLAAIVLLVLLGTTAIDVLSSARAWVGGESLWAKGEKEAVYALTRFARTRSAADYRDYLADIAVPLGDEAARRELDRPEPDLGVVRRGLLAGGNDPDDIPGMVRLYQRLGRVGVMARAIAIWAAGDARIAELTAVADRIHAQAMSDPPDAAALQSLVDRATAIDRALTPMEQAFSSTLGEASRITKLVLQAMMVGMGCALVLLAIAVSRRMSRRTERAEIALRLSEERLHLAVTGSNHGVWDWDLRTQAVYYSPRVGELLGVAPDALTRDADALLRRLHPDDAEHVRASLVSHLRGRAPYEAELRLRTGAAAAACAEFDAYRWFLVRGQSVRDATGRALRLAGSLEDITEKKLGEAAILRQALQQGLMAAFGQKALENPEIGALTTRAVEIVDEGLHVEFCRLLTLDRCGLHATLEAGTGWHDGWHGRGPMDAAQEIGDRAIGGGNGEPVLVDDYEDDPRRTDMLREHAIRSGAELVVAGSLGIYGLLGVYSRKPGRFSQESLNFLRGITNTLASAMDRKVSDQQLMRIAQFDPLTSLPNRSLYLDRLLQTIHQARRDHRFVGVLFIDLDRFKMVNDTLGHGAGDDLLLQVAQRLQACVRACDTVGRLGGDEFSVALDDMASPEDAGIVANKIVAALALPFDVLGQQLYVSASVGISIFPSDGTEPDELLKNADTAMYRVKQAGRNSHQFYLSRMNEQAVERLRLETQLRGALDRGEFLLHYQPKVDLASGRLSGFEALLRWQHPERGLVPPGDFIAILEDTGLIIAVGQWVIAEACRQLMRWRAAGLEPRPVAVNISARQFAQKELVDIVGAILRETAVGPDLLEFELTESMLMSDPEGATRALASMKAFGIRLAVDDFGTGYSSLAYLKRFPLDTLKIDRAFVRDVPDDTDDATIAIAIIQLARSLHLNVVAEGVETEAQLAFLKAHGCIEGQGYLFARPLPVAAATRLLEGDGMLPAAPASPPTSTPTPTPAAA